MLKRFSARFEHFIRPFAKFLVSIGITPNKITVLGIVLSLATSYFIISGSWVYATLFLLITIFSDALDGAVARASRKETKFGDFFDAFIDRAVETITYLSLAYVGYSIAVIALALSYLVSYIAARAEVWTIGKKIRYISIGSRAERMIVLAIGFALISVFYLDYIFYALVLISILCVIGILQRLYQTYKTLKK